MSQLMNPKALRLPFLVMTAAAAMAASAQEEITLRVQGVPGSVSSYDSTSDVTINFDGEELTIRSTESIKVALVKSEEGVVTFEREMIAGSSEIDGQEMPRPPAEEADIAVYTVDQFNNTLTFEKKSGEEEDPEMAALGSRLAQSSTIIFPEEAMKVGHKWTKTFAANSDLLTPAGKGSYTLAAIEDVLGVKAAKVTFTYEETGGEINLKSNGTIWVEVATGDEIKSDYAFSNVPFAMGFGEPAIAEGTTTSERTSGTFTQAATETEEEQEKPEKPEEKPIDKKIKDFEKQTGFVTVYQKEERGRKKIYLEIPRGLLGQMMMLQTTASTGTGSVVVAGQPISDIVFKLERGPGKKLYMVVPNYLFRADPATPIAQAVKRSFTDSVIQSFEIDAEQDDRDALLIDVSTLFTGNIGEVFSMLSGGGGGPASMFGGGGFSPDREKTYVSKIKPFPENLYVESVYGIRGSSASGPMAALMPGTLADPRGGSVKVSYLLMPLDDESSYSERRFDSRVGYFTTRYQDFTDDTAEDQKVVNIQRWNLKKKDPNAEVSEPIEPLVWWLDSAIPNRHKDEVRAGLLEWNKAFEAIGYKNAVVVKEMTPDMELDHADVRYNTVRWVTSPDSGYAIALFRANPITGQIINASITIDSAIARTIVDDHDLSIDPASVFLTDNERLKKALYSAEHGWACRACQEGRVQAAVGLMAAERLAQVPPVSRDEFLGQFMKWVVMHEFGHTLGLRHHFSASTQFDMKQLADKSLVEQKGTAASVMDYVPFNPAGLKSGSDYWAQSIGVYDYLAIKYGYSELNKLKPDHEMPELSRIGSEVVKAGVAWQGDEYADMIDPHVTRFDLSARPIEYWTEIMNMSNELLMTLDQNEPKQGMNHYQFTRDFHILLGYYTRGASQLSRYIGGIERSPGHRGDGSNVRIAPIDSSQQRAALKLLDRRVFSRDAFDFPKHYYKMFVNDPKAGMLESIMGGTEHFPMMDSIAGVQRSALGSLLSSSTLARVQNHEFEAEAGDKPLKLSELFETVRKSVWSELGSSSSIPPLRRQLQREHISILINLGVKGRSQSESGVQAWGQLKSIRNRIKSSGGGDRDTRLHLEQTAMRIDRALSAVETVGGGSSRPESSLLDLLMGGIGR